MATSCSRGLFSFLLDTLCMRYAAMKSNVSSSIGRVSNVVIKWSNEGGRLLNKVMTTSSSFIGTSKHVSWLTRDFTFLMWSNMLSHSSNLMVKNLHLKLKMFYKLFILCVLHNVHVSSRPLHPLMCNWWHSIQLWICQKLYEIHFQRESTFVAWAKTKPL